VSGSSVAVQHLSRWWGATRAVDDVSFEAAAGKMLVLLGPSGCGKSTTLRLIAGLETATGGRVLIGGVDVTRRPPAERRLSMVFQSYALFPHLSVAENIVFGLRVRRVGGTERQERLARVADLLGLGALLERKPSQLSGGQQQRVALGRALIAETPVCLMDEPLSNLDAQLRLEMRREIRALQQSLGITMVYVTHDQTEAMTMADQIVLLREGRVEQDAPPHRLYASPATAFTARFIGTPPMNILATPGAAILLGVRPEDIRVGTEPGPRTVEARVTSVEYLGADSILLCAAAGQSIAVRAPGRVELPAGRTVHLSWRKDTTHVFDAKTGRRRDDVADLSTPSRS
jgi:sn-glycerol 3-phosphate transport system ATP-binding protein